MPMCSARLSQHADDAYFGIVNADEENDANPQEEKNEGVDDGLEEAEAGEDTGDQEAEHGELVPGTVKDQEIRGVRDKGIMGPGEHLCFSQCIARHWLVP